jgi:hypothetical protein
LLGAAAEDCGLDRKMKANTVKRRSHSLFRQGCFFYACIPTMPEHGLDVLMRSFRQILAKHAVFRQIFAYLRGCVRGQPPAAALRRLFAVAA